MSGTRQPVGGTSTAASVVDVMRAVTPPRPVLTRRREAELTDRQREILDELGRMVSSDGFIDLTMADLAARLNCSLRTLYLLAGSRNELVVMVIDRVLRSHGRAAHSAVTADMSALEAIGAYLHAANNAVSAVTPEFAADMAAIDEGSALNEAHSNYLIDVTKALLDLAIDRGEIELTTNDTSTASVDTAALARMLGGLGRDFARPEVLGRLDHSPARSANAMVDLVLDGLRRSTK